MKIIIGFIFIYIFYFISQKIGLCENYNATAH